MLNQYKNLRDPFDIQNIMSDLTQIFQLCEKEMEIY